MERTNTVARLGPELGIQRTMVKARWTTHFLLQIESVLLKAAGILYRVEKDAEMSSERDTSLTLALQVRGVSGTLLSRGNLSKARAVA